MLEPIKRVFQSPDLRTKIFFTLGVLALYRLGSFIPAPGINATNVKQCLDGGTTTGGVYDLVNMFSGGALLSVSILALGVMPYITASILMQLLRVIVPRLQELHKEGASGTAKTTQYTRYVAVGLAAVNATTVVTMARNGTLMGGCQLPIVANDSVMTALIMIIALTAGAMLVMWMGEKITEHGVGNGLSLLIFTSIAAGFPSSLGAIGQTQGWGVFAAVIAVGLLTMTLVVLVEQSQRRLKVVYSKRVVAGKTYGGNATFLPIKVNMAGIVPVIFASALLSLPSMAAQFATKPDGTSPDWAVWITRYLTVGDHPLYMAVYFLLIVGFAFFYVSITFEPDEIAENMRKYGGFIPGYRAGKQTRDLLAYTSNRITAFGALYIGILSLIPLIALVLINANQNFPFGGAAILIIVGVGLETIKQISSQVDQRNYGSLLR
ncbi:preprotein translocase subunit SecY [Arthrobacter sp. zg-Y1110]|uniref:preprotein translocase subunit SecY n=1 Tax=Arthrobacter sp. zg-Y1110 TaxID=2886932 RepID=UPI001D13CFA6|nr:preprotein translocase subunit SecY [Arthrobacter sp. zg-Y1110]MCC3292442.1 preprotein translocase subunit SecY [Arthrobacter sp. zg-Y1110]UWX87125.1 preprotein translocase subunit SecY [Arthrobacter sp. zg-Y1110]